MWCRIHMLKGLVYASLTFQLWRRRLTLLQSFYLIFQGPQLYFWFPGSTNLLLPLSVLLSLFYFFFIDFIYFCPSTFTHNWSKCWIDWFLYLFLVPADLDESLGVCKVVSIGSTYLRSLLLEKKSLSWVGNIVHIIPYRLVGWKYAHGEIF